MKPKTPKQVKMENWMVLGKVTKPVVIEVEPQGALKYLDWMRERQEWRYLRERGGGKRGKVGKVRLVMVFGSSGSGKDVVTETIEKELGKQVVHLASDWYYGPLGMDEGRTVFINNYDHVNSVDWDLMKLHLKNLREGYRVKAPIYDFTTHSRVGGEYKLLKPKPIIMVSGIMVAHTLRSLVDLTIGVEADYKVCVNRRIRRDIKERGRTEKQCKEQIKNTVRKGYREFVRPYIKMIKEGEWDGEGEAMLVDNRKDADTPNEPARVNKEVYLERIRQLIK